MASEAPPAPEDGYRSLSVEAVLADLASLSSDQLLLVKSLEEAGDRRAAILDRIDDLLVVHEATHHILQAAAQHGAAPPKAAPPKAAPLKTAPAPPTAAPGRPVSPDLVDQMGDLLAKDAARRTPDLPTAAPEPAASAAPAGVIMPKRRRTSHHGRATKVLVFVIILAMIGAVGGVFWKQTHKTNKAASLPPAPTLSALMLPTIPGGTFHQVSDQPGPGTPRRPSDMASALGVSGASPVLPDPAGFVDGYFRDWTATNGQGAVTMLLARFRTAADAAASAGETASIARTGATDVAQANSKVGNASQESSFSPAGIPGAAGFVDTGVVNRAQVVFSRGIYVVVLISPADGASQIATAQYDRLPAN